MPIVREFKPSETNVVISLCTAVLAFFCHFAKQIAFLNVLLGIWSSVEDKGYNQAEISQNKKEEVLVNSETHTNLF